MMIGSGLSFHCTAFILGFATVGTTIQGYVPFSCNLSRTPVFSLRPLSSKLFGPDDDFDDNIGRIGESSTGGDSMVNDFFKEVKKREETLQSTETSSGIEDDIISKIQNTDAEPWLLKAPTAESDGDYVPPTKKFTGQERFYAPRPSVPGTGLSRQTPRETMMEREYQLVGRAERGIVVQAIIAVMALVFYIYVGLSGGIVSGTDAQMRDFGADDEIPFEQLMPVQRDREVSIWL